MVDTSGIIKQVTVQSENKIDSAQFLLNIPIITKPWVTRTELWDTQFQLLNLSVDFFCHICLLGSYWTCPCGSTACYKGCSREQSLQSTACMLRSPTVRGKEWAERATKQSFAEIPFILSWHPIFLCSCAEIYEKKNKKKKTSSSRKLRQCSLLFSLYFHHSL